MSNPWFRLYSEFSHDPKVQMLSEAMQRRYVMLMCMRCSDVTVTLRDDEIAFHLRISDAELSQTKVLFIDKGFVDEHWNLLNWDKRQFKSDHDPSGAQRQKRFRDKKRRESNALRNGPITRPDTDTDTYTETEGGGRVTPASSPNGSPPLFSQEYREFIKAERPDLDPAVTFANFTEHYPPNKRTTTTWHKWVRREQAGKACVNDSPLADPDSKASVEAVGMARGLGKWNETELWSAYKSRVRSGSSGASA
jgi:hypothetical protein